MTTPAHFPPPFDARDYVAPPTDPEDERIEVGVLIVGAGPAGLACAIRLGQLLEDAPQIRERLGEVPVAVLDKGKQPGSHLLSGAVVNPRALRRLFKGRKRIDEMPFYGPVHGESVYFLTQGGALPIPTPPTMKNEGNYVASLSQLGRWLAEQAEEAGAMILPRRPPTSSSSATAASAAFEPATRARAATDSPSGTSSRAPTSSGASRSSPRGRRDI